MTLGGVFRNRDRHGHKTPMPEKVCDNWLIVSGPTSMTANRRIWWSFERVHHVSMSTCTVGPLSMRQLVMANDIIVPLKFNSFSPNRAPDIDFRELLFVCPRNVNAICSVESVLFFVMCLFCYFAYCFLNECHRLVLWSAFADWYASYCVQIERPPQKSRTNPRKRCSGHEYSGCVQ